MNESLTRDLMRSLTSDLAVGAAPVGPTIVRGRRLRARRRVVASAAVAAVAAGTLVAAGLLDRIGDTSPDPVAPPAVQLSHSWWADGTLHLPRATVPMPDVRELVQIPGGLVVLTGPGEVRRVDDDGDSRLIGHWRSGAPRDDLSPTVRAQDDGTVVWLDGTTTPAYSFVVYDPASGRQVAAHAIPTGGFHEAAHLNEFEDGVVYWDSGAYGQRGWDISTDGVTRIGTGATLLLALENGIWATYKDHGTGIEVSSAGKRLWASNDDLAWLSPDGAQLVTLSGSVPLRFSLRDTLTGREVADPVQPSTDPARAYLDRVYLGNDHQLTYVLGTEGPGGIVPPYDLVSCDLDASRCTTIVEGAAERPVLPSD